VSRLEVMMACPHRRFAVKDYDLEATLTCGQAFRWTRQGDVWTGVIGQRQVRLRGDANGIEAEVGEPIEDWGWLEHYLQVSMDYQAVVDSFPGDEPMRAAVRTCRGLRLLRQDPWECLASFILSSTKQISQIQQIVASLCERFGDEIQGIAANGPVHAFPPPERVAAAKERELRLCKMGFRAPYLRQTARLIASGEFNLEAVGGMPVPEARAALMRLPGVGRKIADCVLLFACGQPGAFPLDVWVMKALRQLYFPGRFASPRKLHQFAASHFGPNAGYAQQYLFHYARTKHPVLSRRSSRP
jgi:N-glycosylase/DNA lyase